MPSANRRARPPAIPNRTGCDPCSWRADLFAHNIGRSIHGAEMDASEVLAENAQGKELGAREDDDDRGEEEKAGDDAADHEVDAEDVGQDGEAEDDEEEAHAACDLQRQGT